MQAWIGTEIDAMKYTCLVLVLFFLQDDVPFKPLDEFEIKLNFEFKDRPRVSPNRVYTDRMAGENERSQGTGPLPYLYLNLRVLKQKPEEVRIRILINGNKTVLNKKFDVNTVLKLDLGFTDDIKDRVGPYEYNIFFLTKDKDPVSKVIVYFDEDGTYFVNGQLRGKL